jgi:hypothetical protein
VTEHEVEGLAPSSVPASAHIETTFPQTEHAVALVHGDDAAGSHERVSFRLEALTAGYPSLHPKDWVIAPSDKEPRHEPDRTA